MYQEKPEEQKRGTICLHLVSAIVQLLAAPSLAE